MSMGNPQRPSEHSEWYGTPLGSRPTLCLLNNHVGVEFE